ncbi:MAG: uridine diphosphate-N-acetylglucosamine-binding protein YvcK, partial [bacterium]|nr:uridine diphosphate-N-acetylglucosamine-binding protein YvcK [bacterium]
EGEGLAGHTFGNLFITALERITGDFSRAIQEAAKFLSVKGEVIPVTLDKVRLHARLENGEEIKGEANIDIPKHNGWLKIKEVYLEPVGRANKKAVEAIGEADLIVIGPGDLYTSVIPNLIVRDISAAVKKSKAKKVFVCNLMTKFGETNGFRASDFLRVMENHLGKELIDYFIVNAKKPGLNRLKKYSAERADFVEYDKEKFKGKKPLVLTGDFLRREGFLRHDPDKLAKVLTFFI